MKGLNGILRDSFAKKCKLETGNYFEAGICLFRLKTKTGNLKLLLVLFAVLLFAALPAASFSDWTIGEKVL